jgi:hypothetical protein
MALATLAYFILTWYYIDRVRKGDKVTIRNMPGLQAVDEAIGAAVEQGRPVHYTPGFCWKGFDNLWTGPPYLAGLNLISHISERCVAQGADLFITLCRPEAVPIALAASEVHYAAAGMPTPPDLARFITTEQYPFAAAQLSMIKGERPGANIMFGNFWSEAFQLIQAGYEVGAIQIGGTTGGNMPFFVAACDYALIGEELFAAAAYVAQDEVGLGAIRGQDAFRVIIILITLVGWLATNVGITGIII